MTSAKRQRFQCPKYVLSHSVTPPSSTSGCGDWACEQIKVPSYANFQRTGHGGWLQLLIQINTGLKEVVWNRNLFNINLLLFLLLLRSSSSTSCFCSCSSVLLLLLGFHAESALLPLLDIAFLDVLFKSVLTNNQNSQSPTLFLSISALSSITTLTLFSFIVSQCKGAVFWSLKLIINVNFSLFVYFFLVSRGTWMCVN